jgi:hypothetical protein
MIRTFLRRLRNWSRSVAGPDQRVDHGRLRERIEAGRSRLNRIRRESAPRIALVKQDVCEDLYCAPAGATPRELVESTQLRTGPVLLLTDWDAKFHMVETIDAPECRMWQERSVDLNWDSLEFFASYRDRIPGKDFGQRRYAVPPDAIDWSRYDLVVSVDVCVPEAITRRYPCTAWAYYVREVKAPAYRRGIEAPAPGQDLFLNHGFRWEPGPLPRHVIEFPYHLQRYGCFHQLFAVDEAAARTGVFVDHHTLVRMSPEDVARLAEFGPVTGPILPPELRYEAGKSVPPRRTMDPDLRERLLNSRFFLVTPGQRPVHGTAMVEAIAAGCLAIGSTRNLQQHGFIFTEHTAADDLMTGIDQMRRLTADDELYTRELQRQRDLIEWLCAVRPTLALVDTAERVLRERGKT